jgi:hypothetical protein
MVPTLMPRGTNRNTHVIASSASTHYTQHNHDSVADGLVSAAATAEGQLQGAIAVYADCRLAQTWRQSMPDAKEGAAAWNVHR